LWKNAAAPGGAWKTFGLPDPGPPLRSGPGLHAGSPSGGLVLSRAEGEGNHEGCPYRGLGRRTAGTGGMNTDAEGKDLKDGKDNKDGGTKGGLLRNFAGAANKRAGVGVLVKRGRKWERRGGRGWHANGVPGKKHARGKVPF